MKTSLYKYINLLFRIAIGIIAVWFIYDKLKNNWETISNGALFNSVRYEFILLVALLLFVNWGLESKKWQYLIQHHIKINFIDAFKIILSGITIGLITPNRIGEIPARVLLLKDKIKIKELVVLTSIGAFSQLIITILLGSISLLFISNTLDFRISPILLILVMFIITIFLLVIYFFNQHFTKLINRIKFIDKRNLFEGLSHFSMLNLSYILGLSLIRYIVFSIQFYLILTAFNIQFEQPYQIALIPLCFMITSIIPTVLISEIGVRGSVALFVFSSISNLDINILAASILLWLINVAIPALLGIFNLKSFKLIKPS